jgi:hypothetical protein
MRCPISLVYHSTACILVSSVRNTLVSRDTWREEEINGLRRELRLETKRHYEE